MIALGIPKVTVTINVDKQLGNKCFIIILKLLPPLILHASIYSIFFKRITSPRINLAVEAQPKSPNARYKLTKPGPKTNMIAIANNKNGKDENT